MEEISLVWPLDLLCGSKYKVKGTIWCSLLR